MVEFWLEFSKNTSMENEKGEKLRLAQVNIISRHGLRTPINFRGIQDFFEEVEWKCNSLDRIFPETK